jgi:polar amino acid transport system substrate-binding protein
MRSFRSWLAVPVSLACVGAIAACGSSSSSSTSSSTSSTPSASNSTSTPAATAALPAVATLVPAAIKSKGTITVAADATYAPNEFVGPDGHTVIGMDADLANALAAAMGLKATISNVKFDAIIPGLAAGKYDMGASSFTDTKAREKTVTFVDYFTAGESFYTKAQGGTTINGIADLCGHTVAVETTTTEQTDAQAQSAKCKKAGKPAVTVLVLGDQNAANLAVASGRAQLGFADTPVAAYQVKKTNGQFKLIGQTFSPAPYGLAIPKTGGLAPAVLAGMKALIANGTYASILAKWGEQGGAIPASAVKINGATS